jgi:hypothetical protein
LKNASSSARGGVERELAERVEEDDALAVVDRLERADLAQRRRLAHQ